MIRDVFLVQPIHEAGVARLRAAGLGVRQASRADMATVAAEVGAADAVVTRNAGLSAAAIDAAPRLRLVVVHGVGHDPVDVGHAAARGIVVCNTPVANAWSVAEHAIALLLALAKETLAADRAVRAGAFDARYALRLTELRGRILGVVGCGRIGRATARIARAGLGMRVCGHSPSAEPGRLRRLGIEPCASLGELLASADVVSLHVPLRAETRGLIGRAELGRMKPGAWLVNTARGALVDHAALVEALRSGRLGGAGLDVFRQEPVPVDDPLLGLPNVVLSPHIGGASDRAMERTALAVAAAILQAARGRRPRHVIAVPQC
ncbi:MAG TPA: NAD(P)-dependent oxidoreductase [Methylomirabilota bacterium]|nr:NAD(P)-dependent oxidoreductase [Methylomirabilota bacterium]